MKPKVARWVLLFWVGLSFFVLDNWAIAGFLIYHLGLLRFFCFEFAVSFFWGVLYYHFLILEGTLDKLAIYLAWVGETWIVGPILARSGARVLALAKRAGGNIFLLCFVFLVGGKLSGFTLLRFSQKKDLWEALPMILLGAFLVSIPLTVFGAGFAGAFFFFRKLIFGWRPF